MAMPPVIAPMTSAAPPMPSATNPAIFSPLPPPDVPVSAGTVLAPVLVLVLVPVLVFVVVLVVPVPAPVPVVVLVVASFSSVMRRRRFFSVIDGERGRTSLCNPGGRDLHLVRARDRPAS